LRQNPTSELLLSSGTLKLLGKSFFKHLKSSFWSFWLSFWD